MLSIIYCSDDAVSAYVSFFWCRKKGVFAIMVMANILEVVLHWQILKYKISPMIYPIIHENGFVVFYIIELKGPIRCTSFI